MREGTGIACAGHWVVDRTRVIDHYPAENSIAEILEETVGSGGCAYNTIINLAKLDPELPLMAIGIVGDDENGQYVLDECSRHSNIDRRFLRQSSLQPTSCTHVYSVAGTGSRTFFHLRGCNRIFTPEAAELDLNRLDVSLLHLGYLTLLDALDEPDAEFGRKSARFLHDVQSRGIRTSLDLVTNSRPDYAEIVRPALPWVDYCIINDSEAQSVTGIAVRTKGGPSLRNLRKIGRLLLDLGVRELAVVHFPEGAYARTKIGEEFFQAGLAVPEEAIKGATGAGDSFCAGLLYGIYRKFGLARSLEFATCVGALNLHHVTTTGAIRAWREVSEVKDRYPLQDPWWESKGRG